VSQKCQNSVIFLDTSGPGRNRKSTVTRHHAGISPHTNRYPTLLRSGSETDLQGLMISTLPVSSSFRRRSFHVGLQDCGR